MRRPVRIAVILVKLDGRHGAGTKPGAKLAARSTHHGLKPGLNAHGVGVDTGLKLLGHGIECLGKALVGAFGREHVRDVVQVDVEEQVARYTAYIADLQQHPARQFALDAEVDHVRAPDLVLGIEARVTVLEYAVGARRLNRSSQTRNNDPAAESRQRWYGDVVAVHPDSEVARGIPAVAADTRAVWGPAHRQVAKADSQRRSEHYPDAVNPVKSAGPTGADHRLLASDQIAQHTVTERWVPRNRQARPKVRVIRVVGILAARSLDGHIAHSRVEHISVQSGRALGFQVGFGINELSVADVNHHGRLSRRVVRRHLHAPSQPVSNGQ